MGYGETAREAMMIDTPGAHGVTTASMLTYAIAQAESKLAALKRAAQFLIDHPETAQFIDDLKHLGLR